MITTSSLLAKIKLSGGVPKNLPEGTNEIILQAINDMVQNEITTALLDSTWDGLIRAEEISDGVVEWPIPERAIGERIVGVYTRRDRPADAQKFDLYTRQEGVLYFYQDTSNLQVKYFLRLPTLVEESYEIESVSGSDVGLSVAFTGNAVDLLDSNGRLIAASVPVLSGSGTTMLTLDSTLAEDGGYVAQPGFSSVLPLPVDLESVLVNCAVAALLDIWGDKEDAANRQSKALRNLEKMISIISPPASSQPATMAPGPHFTRRRVW